MLNNKAKLSALAFLLIAPLPAAAEAPLSAIDWLSSSVSAPKGAAIGSAIKPALPKTAPEPPVARQGALPGTVTVAPLDAASADGIGLLRAEQADLPRALWGMGLEDEIIKAIATSRNDLLPALHDMVQMMMLVQTDPPIDSKGKGNLLLARIDWLLAQGALEPAKMLLAQAAPDNAQIFQRNFDVALLTGTEEQACAQMQRLPSLAPTYPARIFCLARSGDWNAAVVTLRTAQALGDIDEAEDALLSRFLDPDLYEEDSLPPPPSRMTPLSWRMFEAIGEPISTTGLPLAFSNAELREIAGWRSQIEAAERLAKVGAVSPRLLFDFYLQRAPAASGGLWDRVAGVQALETALTAKDETATAAALVALWPLMAEAELEVPFATIYAARLTELSLSDPQAQDIAFDLGLLDTEYQDFAAARSPSDPRQRFLKAIALGEDSAGLRAPDSLANAIRDAFTKPPELRPDLKALDDENRQGEALLMAANMIMEGLQGELPRVTQGLSYLRHLGLEDIARRSALELMLLERRG